jgi:fatty acid desaturase
MNTIARQSAPASAIRRRVRQALPRECFRHCPARGLIAAGLVLAIALLQTTSICFLAPSAWAVGLSLCVGALHASLFFLGHEAGHGAMFRNRLAQDLVMFTGFFVFVLSPSLWRVWHNDVHHNFANSFGQDPDNFSTLAAYRRDRSVRLIAALTPGSRHWVTLPYFLVWFSIHSQVVLWSQSRRCPGFESLPRTRAVAESLAMVALWAALAMALGPGRSLLVIAVPMMVANATIMSYIATNHLVRPLTADRNPLANSMSVKTLKWLDWAHFNFSHHVEHHLFPTMSPKYSPLVRALLRQYAPGWLLCPSHYRALLMLINTPRIHDEDGELIDPRSGQRVPFDEIISALCPLGSGTQA